MSSLTTDEARQQPKPISHRAIVGWIAEVRDAVRSTPAARLLDFQGVDGFDVALSQIYLTVLGTLRQGPATQPRVGRLRRLGYLLKKWAQERQAVRYSARPARTDIVLWSRHTNHSLILGPVSRALKDRGAHCQLLACQFNVLEGLAASGEALFTLAAWPQVVREARRDGARRAKQLAALAPWKLPPFPHPNAVYLEPALREILTAAVPWCAEAILNAQAVCERLHPKLLVVGNDITMEGRAGCRVATAHGIPTAVFMHGTIAGDALQAQHCADRLLVSGQGQFDELISHGIDAERIVICGAPNLDDRPRQTGRVHPALAARFGLRPGEPWILVATSGPGHRISQRHHEQVVDSVMRLSAAFPQVPVLVKLHPKDDPAFYQHGLSRRADARLHVVTKKDRGIPSSIFDWLPGCGLLLTGASAAAIEAMLMDVPVITIDYCGEIAGADFIDCGATLHVRTHEALQAAVNKVLAAGGLPDDLRQRVDAFLKRSFFALDGHSAQRGAQALCQLAESPTSPSG